MSLEDLDPHLTVPKRLAAMGLLAAAKRMEVLLPPRPSAVERLRSFEAAEGLTEAGYVTSKRTGKGRTRASWFSITDEGQSALDRHAAALQQLLQPDPPVPADLPPGDQATRSEHKGARHSYSLG